MHKGRGIWITKLSGAGKTTLATEVAKHLRAQHDAVVLLDGAQLHKVFGAASLSKKIKGERVDWRWSRSMPTCAEQ